VCQKHWECSGNVVAAGQMAMVQSNMQQRKSMIADGQRHIHTRDKHGDGGNKTMLGNY
jgi:hypothetical protein